MTQSFLATILMLAAMMPSAFAQSTTSRPAAEALEESVAVERVLMQEDLQRHEQLTARRAQNSVRLQNLYTTVDHLLRQEEGMSSRELKELMLQIEAAERERSQILTDQRFIVEHVTDRLRRIELLEERLGILKERTEAEAGPLEGSWDVVLLPSGQRGSFRLSQIGTLVSGTYTLEGGWSGSLQGTLVSRKVYLVRIDSRLGRSMELEGILSTDGKTIKGNWLNYDLGAQGGAEGQWTATLSD